MIDKGLKLGFGFCCLVCLGLGLLQYELLKPFKSI